MPPKTKATVSPGDAKQPHPLYAAWAPTWRAALDVYEGAGGFLDPTRPYLVPHPREWLDHSIKTSGSEGEKWVPNPTPSIPSPKLTMRRKLARYENIAATILDSVTGALFMHAPSRTFAEGGKDNEQVRQFWANCDGMGTHVDRFLQDSWIVAGVFGHAILLLDKPAGDVPMTAADAQLPRLCRYTPLDLIDWLKDEDGKLIAVKLLEEAPRATFADRARATDTNGIITGQYRVRVIDEEKWTLYDAKGTVIEAAEHGFGRLPIEILYGKRRTLIPVIGKSVMGDPQLFLDVYNLTSEAREILRNQTFAILNVPVGTGEGASVEREQQMIGSQSGTSNILFSSNAAQFISPQGENITAYHEHLDRLARMIYRLANAPWEGDSKAVESADSRKIKREDQNQILLKYASELERTDKTVLELVYRALVGPESWEKAREKDKPSIAYPTSFEPPDLEALVALTAEAIALDLGETATKELKKRTVRLVVPDLTTDQQKQSDDEIEAMDVLTSEDKRQQMIEATAGKMAQRFPGAQPKGDPKVEEKPAA